MSAEVAIGTLFMIACLILEVIGIATPYWMVVDHSTGLVSSHAGLFTICYEILSLKKCVYYFTYSEEFKNVHYFGITGSSLFGGFLLLVASLVGLCGCNKPYAKPVVQNISGVGIAAGFFCSVGAIWYYLYFFQGTFGDLTTILTVFGVDVGPGWSFYLCAAAGGGALLVSIILMIVGCNMPTQNSNVIVPNQQQQPIVIAMTGQHQQHPPSAGIAMQNPAYTDPFVTQPSNGNHYPYSPSGTQKV